MTTIGSVLTKEEVNSWVATFELNYRKDSPFMGMVNMSEVYDLPIPQQRQIYDALPEYVKKKMEGK